MKGYSFDFSKYPEEALAKARIENQNMSFKDAGAVCDAIRNKSVNDALSILESVINREKPILYKKHNKKLAHRKELGGKKGKWPIKEASIIRKGILSLISNAQQKGLNEEALVIIHASANKKASYPKMQPVGRRVRWRYELARVELVALDTSYKERAEKEKKEEKKEKQKAEKQELKEVKETTTKEAEAKEAKKEKQEVKEVEAKKEKETKEVEEKAKEKKAEAKEEKEKDLKTKTTKEKEAKETKTTKKANANKEE